MNTPTLRNVAILVALVMTVAASGCGSKSDATAAPKADAKADAPKPDAAKADAAKPAPAAAAAAAPKPALPVKAEPAKIAQISDNVTAVGSLLADESVVIRPEIDGRITALHFQEGQGVAAGSRLVSLDGSEYEAQLAAVRADLKTEQQRLVRTRELQQQNFISKDALEVQVGNVDRLKAREAEAESKLAKTIIRAPFAGTVGLRMVSPGAYVKAGQDIVRMESLGSLKVDFRIPETFLAKVKSNQDISVNVDAYPHEDFKGRVYAIEPMVDERSRTIAMRARIPNQGNKLKPGMFVRVAVTLENRPNAVTVPEEAIWPQGKDSYVFKVVDGKAALTKVDIGNRQPGRVEIVKGLAANDMVVTEGQIKLRDGAPVSVIAPPAPAANGAPAATPPAKS